MQHADIDRPLIARYAALAALTALIPVPLLDRWLENRMRRSLVRRILARREVVLTDAERFALADRPTGGCLGLFFSVLIWPIKKLARTLFFVWELKGVADTGSEVFHRALLLEEAIDQGWLPGNVPRVRAAMDVALAKVDVRLVERALFGKLRDPKHDLNRAVWAAARSAREDAALPEPVLVLSNAMSAAIATTGLVPELVVWFRAEMGTAPGQ